VVTPVPSPIAAPVVPQPVVTAESIDFPEKHLRANNVAEDDKILAEEEDDGVAEIEELLRTRSSLSEESDEESLHAFIGLSHWY
jgi:hypothetical protein